jgi:tripartite ATP-independent transporter DctP family solute receptor
MRMINITRRQLVTAAASLPLFNILTSRANAAEFVYKFGNNVPETHPTNVAAKTVIERIREESGGRVDIQRFPNSQLGNDTDMLSQVRSGELEFYLLSPLRLSNLIPDAGVSGLGFLFSDYTAVWRALDGELGTYVRSLMPSVQLVGFSKIWDNGFRHVTSNSKPITTAADIKGMKIRVPSTRLWTSLFKSLGAVPTGLDFAELYTALQTRIVDGQENPLSIISFGKLYEVQKYCAFTGHMWDGFWLVANKTQWERLPAEMQDIVARNFDLAAAEQRKEIGILNTSLQDELEKKGMVFKPADRPSFQKTLIENDFYKEWQEQFSEQAWKLVQEYGEVSL